jgi:hypothetical protein
VAEAEQVRVEVTRLWLTHGVEVVGVWVREAEAGTSWELLLSWVRVRAMVAMKAVARVMEREEGCSMGVEGLLMKWKCVGVCLEPLVRTGQEEASWPWVVETLAEQG